MISAAIFILFNSLHNTISLLPSRVHLNTEDFKTLLLNNRQPFIDKTDLILDYKIPPYLSPPNLKVILAPSGWGKSTNINMLKTFYEIEIDDEGLILPRNQTINDKLFLGGEIEIGVNETKTLAPLKISNHLDFIEHLGKYPVIMLNLKNSTGNTYEEMVHEIKKSITNTYKNHEYLIHSSNVTGKDKLENFLSGQYNSTDIPTSLDFLGKKLRQHFGKFVIILIDDFDVPVVNAFLKLGKDSEDFNRIIKLITELCKSPVRDPFYHRNVRMQIVTGVFKATQVLTGANSIQTSFPVIPHPMTGYGFTIEELRESLTKPLRLNFKQIEDWYGGYYFNYSVYLNPQSVLQCIAHNGTFGHYYDEHANNVTNEYIDRILSSNEVQFEMQFWISEKIKNYRRSISKIGLFETTIWEQEDKLKVLFHAGYFFTTITALAFDMHRPRNYIMHKVKTKAVQWVAKTFNATAEEFHIFVNQLAEGNIEEFNETLQRFFLNSATYCCNNTYVADVFYRCFVQAINYTLSSNNSIREDVKNDEILFIPRIGQSDIAIMLKYQICDQGTDLLSLVKTNLEKMSNRCNADKLKAQNSHVKNIIKISIVFCNEKYAIEYDKV